jgi:hypothetical protein
MALSAECEVHGWSWDPADDMGCPVCYGIETTEERIIKLLESVMTDLAWDGATIKKAIALIKGEHEQS